jgi:hypothetical protein
MEVRHVHESSNCTTAANSLAKRMTPAAQQKPVTMQLLPHTVLNKTHASERKQISVLCLITIVLKFYILKMATSTSNSVLEIAASTEGETGSILFKSRQFERLWWNVVISI